jgi:hypothetical protein
LQAFIPLQECFAAIVAVSPEVPGELMVEPLPLELSLLQPMLIEAAPATSPVIAAAARNRVDRAGIECSFQNLCPLASRPRGSACYLITTTQLNSELFPSPCLRLDGSAKGFYGDI